MQHLAKKPIKKLPSGFPTKGIIRGDHGEWIVLAHADRNPHISKDGVNWEEVTPSSLSDPEKNRVIATFERKRWER